MITSKSLTKHSWNLFSLPGSCMDTNSREEDNLSIHGKYVDAPPPEWGKQKIRKIALGFFLYVTHHLFSEITSALPFYKFFKLASNNTT